jgi:GAF domain-containing protein
LRWRLRARPQVLDLHGLDTQLCGDLAFPMTARGQLIGVVVLGSRSSGETYAPDETAAIADLATSLGAALDTFATKSGDVLERMVASMDALRDEIRSSITLKLPKVN